MNFKVLTIGSLMAAAVLTSCEKNNLVVPTTEQTNPENQTGVYSLNFKTSGFSTQVNPMGIQSRAAVPYLGQLIVLLYKDGKLVNQNIQYTGSGKAIDGNISFKDLAAGSYTLVVAGGTPIQATAPALQILKGFADPANNAFANLAASQNQLNSAPNRKNTDLFYKKETFTLSNDLTLGEVKLERLTGKLEIVLDDLAAFPAEVTSVEVQIADAYEEYNVATETFAKVVPMIYRSTDLADATRLNAFVMATGDKKSYTVKLIARKANGFAVKTLDVVDVKFYPNKITRLKGDFFPAVPAAGMTFSVNEDLKDAGERLF